MEIELNAEAKSKRLNRLVAITVVCASVFMGLSKIRDDNLVQAMQVAKSNALDTWNEYQATKLKQHVVEVAAAQAPSPAFSASAARYAAEAPKLKDKAQGFEAEYDRLNIHDDQFDASDAMLSIAVSLAAVAALVEAPAVLAAAWVFAALGLFMGLAGFAQSNFHPAILGLLLGG
jgi:hypothetical protein